ncbi:hypothetical protein TanjilG_31828 [Lupinus angustifolius]|uniref:Uncharacterized protein n=1 Tax=Lupinus angustifolius TaxID=3871 RepID=A0A1J7HNS4_LUPAN|nr:PREDICTED: uncharacterized protein LOC109358481 [Lupinus angustifolius]XP_019458281.1 PREDICTED: uncharacterized protein LOC109358481 [Lupinus angustifolius]OIW03381.1 hypothetical protein TanjilG_31828 [Lupinus angustifolius]
MSDPYERAKGGRLAFKGGDLATRSKTIDKKRKKKKNKNDNNTPNPNQDSEIETQTLDGEEPLAPGAAAYTIDAAKKMKYEELFPVEARKFGYEPKKATNFNSVEDALDHRVKKKADRYCK